MPHELESARHLADFHGFYKRAIFNRDGTADLTLVIPEEMKDHILAVSKNDGLALNISMWETETPVFEDLDGLFE